MLRYRAHPKNAARGSFRVVRSASRNGSKSEVLLRFSQTVCTNARLLPCTSPSRSRCVTKSIIIMTLVKDQSRMFLDVVRPPSRDPPPGDRLPVGGRASLGRT
eukprot:1195941-Prorocentrum_minimum.AAC.4